MNENKKSADRCAELVEKLKHVCDHWSMLNEYRTEVVTVEQIKEILSEFSKDAGKEGR